MSIKNLLAATIFFFAVSCTKDDAISNTVPDSIKRGGWVVTKLTEPGEDNTSKLSGYIFSFGQDGVLTATSNSVTKTGTWSVGSNRFYIDLGAKTNENKPLGELTDDWVIVYVTDTRIILKDDNSASNENLEFTKQ